MMVDFDSTQARAKEVSPSTSREGGQAEVTTTKPPSTSPSLTVDGVEKMYHQLAEIHAIPTAQLVECARWLRSDSTLNPIQARTHWSKPVVLPSTIRLAPSLATDSLSHA
jgi:hypothetical protein